MTNTGSGTDAAADAARHFRQTLGNYPTGVAIITAMIDGVPAGMVVGSFTSVSLDPPLVAFFADNGSSSWAKIKASPTFCVNVLSSSQEQLSRQFVRRDGDKFEGVEWRPAPASGAPVLAGATAWIDCEVDSITQYGDHQMVVGRVRELGSDAPAAPLIFHRGGYGEFHRRDLISAPERDLVDALRLVDLSRGVVGRLSADLGLECTINASIGAESVVVARMFPDFTDVVGSPVGYRVTLAAPLGPALMAWAPEDELEAWFSRSPVKFTPETKQQHLEILAQLRETGWTWFTKDTDFQRIQALLDRGAAEGMSKDDVRKKIEAIAGQPEFKFMPATLEPGRSYEVYSFVAPVVLPDRSTVIGLNVIGPATPLPADRITEIGERLRTAAEAVAELGSVRTA